MYEAIAIERRAKLTAGLRRTRKVRLAVIAAKEARELDRINSWMARFDAARLNVR